MRSAQLVDLAAEGLAGTEGRACISRPWIATGGAGREWRPQRSAATLQRCSPLCAVVHCSAGRPLAQRAPQLRARPEPAPSECNEYLCAGIAFLARRRPHCHATSRSAGDRWRMPKSTAVRRCALAAAEASLKPSFFVSLPAYHWRNASTSRILLRRLGWLCAALNAACLKLARLFFSTRTK